MQKILLYIIFISTSFGFVVFADPETEKFSTRHNIEITLPSALLKSDITKDFSYNRWDSIPGTSDFQFVGIHSTIFSQFKRRTKQQAEDDLRREYNLTNLTDSSFARRMNMLNSGPTNHWWNRSWIYSLPLNKGGAPIATTTKTYGWDFKIPTNFPVLSWIEEKFNNIGDVWINTDKEFVEERGQNPERNDKKVDNNISKHELLEMGEPDVLIKNRYRWFENTNFHIRFKPIVKFNPYEFINEVALRIQVEMLYKSLHFSNLNIFVKHNIKRQETFISAFIELMSW